MSKESFPSKDSIDSIINPRKAKFITGAAAVAVGLAFLANGCSAKYNPNEADIYSRDIVKGATEISVCNGAKVRDNPTVREDGTSGETNLLHKVNFGDLPEGACIKVAVDGSTVYRTEDSRGHYADGTWFGVPESVLAQALPGSGLDEKDSDNLVWINHQRASVNSREQDTQPQSESEKVENPNN